MKIPEDILKLMSETLKVNALSFWDLLIFNNPSSLIVGMRTLGLTNDALPKVENIVPVLQRLIARKDTNVLGQLKGEFVFDTTNKNFTTNPQLWALLGLPVGDVNGLFAKVYNN